MKKARTVTFALFFLISILPSLPEQWASIPMAWLLPAVQATDLTEADQLLEQATSQMENSQFAEAIGLLEQALIIYRDHQDLRGEAGALKELGILYYRLGDYSKSIDLQQQGLSLARRLGDDDLEARFLNNLGLTYQTLGDPSKAREHFEHSLFVARQQQNRQIENIALGNLVVLYLNRGDYRQATELLEELLAAARSMGDRQSEGKALVYLGLTYASLGETEKAIAWYQKSLPVIRQLNDQEMEGQILFDMGLIYESLEQYEDAAAAFGESLALKQALKDPSGQAAVLAALLRVYPHLPPDAGTIDYLHQMLAIAQDLGNRQLQILMLVQLGATYFLQGDQDKAIDYVQRGLTIGEELEPGSLAGHALELKSFALDVLVSAYEARKEWKKVIEYGNQRLALARQLKDHQAKGSMLRTLGNAHNELGDSIRAIRFYNRALSVTRNSNDPDGEIHALMGLSGIYGMLGDFQRSTAFQEEALNVAREHDDPKGQAMALQGLANSYFLRGEFDKAQGFFQQSGDLGRQIDDRNIEAGALQGLGSLAFARGDYRKAIDYWQKYLDSIKALDEPAATLTGINRQLEGMGLQFLARAYATAGQHARGIDLADQALRLAQTSQNTYEIAGALDALGYTLFVSGKLPEAEKILRQALQEWETVRVGLGEADLEKVSLLDVQTTTYDLLQQVLVAQNKPHEALEIAERGRARAFAEALMTRPDRASVGTVQVDSPGIEGIRQLAKEIDATLVEYSIIYDPTKVLLPERIRGEQAFLEDELLIWVVRPSDEIVFRRVDLKPLRQQGTSLTQLVGSSRNRIEGRGRGVVQLSDIEKGPKKPFQRLYDLLIQPIDDLLPSNPEDRVIFIPQGPLFLLSFPALIDPSDHYLIERHTIQTAPSIGVLASLPKAGERTAWKPSDVLIVGNPAIAPELKGEPFLLGNLTGAEREAHAIAQQFQTRAITGEQASKQTIVRQMPQAGLIHMASHGLLETMGSRDLPGALVLAPSGEDNGLLTAAEIMDLQLNADLVVLSACDTGRGRITGDGVVGLARSFITAGVPSVVVSLWAIPDSPTAFLMTEFYRHLKTHPDTAQALRQAMLAAIDLKYNPGEWAAFTLIGRL